MNIVAFLGESYQKVNGICYAWQTSAAFLQDTVGKENVYVCSPCKSIDVKPEDFSSDVQDSSFYTFPAYSSTKDFVIKAMFTRGYLKQYRSLADEVINKHSGDFFWIRTPSIGSIVFGLRVLNAGEKVIHHMCADASNTWQDAKYTLPEKFFGYLLSQYIRFKLKQICKHKNTINVCTGNVLENFSRQYSPNKTYQFVDIMAQSVEKTGSTSADNEKKNIFNLLFVGRIVEDKGIFDLLYAINRIKVGVSLTVVGGGESLQSAQEFVKANGLVGVVTFTGQLPNIEVSKLYKVSDAVVVPSNNFYEGFPRVIMEAWSHEKPVIVSNVGGIKAFVQDNKNGLIFTPGDKIGLYEKIDHLLTNAALQKDLMIGASAMVKVSNKEYWVRTLRDILQKHVGS